MQLEKVVAFHKALADPTRIRMLILLARGELNGQTLADKLGVTPATITHHAAKLREASLVHERRDKNTIYFSFNSDVLNHKSKATLDLISRSAEGENHVLDDKHTRIKQSVLKNFFTSDGKLKSIPVQLKKKLIVLEHLVSQLDKERAYSENEINEFIKPYFDDYATIRREFIMHHFMYRENQIYELNPPEMWTKWESLS